MLGINQPCAFYQYVARKRCVYIDFSSGNTFTAGRMFNDTHILRLIGRDVHRVTPGGADSVSGALSKEGGGTGWKNSTSTSLEGGQSVVFVKEYEAVISAVGLFSGANSHFILEILPGLLYILEVLGPDFPAHILYEETSITKDMMALLTDIGLINASHYKLLPLQSPLRGLWDHAVQTRGPAHVFAKEVFFAAHYPGSCLTHSQNYAAPETSGRVRRILAHPPAAPERRNLIIVVHRKQTGQRGMPNENELVAVLQGLLAERAGHLRSEGGYRVVLFSHKDFVSFAEIIAFFKQAAVIIGVHGAGLANMMFAAQCTTVIEIMWTDDCTKPAFAASQVCATCTSLLEKCLHTRTHTCSLTR